ncbi:MAG: CPBP family intramembrane metalloprotease [Treponema sp.]|nr:CPBP family intramembrane metalloprotease [Treponema sp.]
MLFFVIFFTPNTPHNYPFEGIGYSLIWRIPALVLILLLMEKKPLISPKKDILTLTAALPALVVIGFLASFCATHTGHVPPEELVPPGGIKGWIDAILLSFSVGFLEEAYFRVYLPERLLEQSQERTRRSVINAFVVSSLIFALCHAYEGPWGIVNAVLAALVLSLAYIKSSSFLGIALAHGLFNIFVFLNA